MVASDNLIRCTLNHNGPYGRPAQGEPVQASQRGEALEILKLPSEGSEKKADVTNSSRLEPLSGAIATRSGCLLNGSRLRQAFVPFSPYLLRGVVKRLTARWAVWLKLNDAAQLRLYPV